MRSPRFESRRPAAGRSDRQCTPITECVAGQYLLAEATATRDQTCKPCDGTEASFAAGFCTTTTVTTSSATTTSKSSTSTTKSSTTTTLTATTTTKSTTTTTVSTTTTTKSSTTTTKPSTTTTKSSTTTTTATKSTTTMSSTTTTTAAEPKNKLVGREGWADGSKTNLGNGNGNGNVRNPCPAEQVDPSDCSFFTNAECGTIKFNGQMN
eukprot:gene25715-34207_t